MISQIQRYCWSIISTPEPEHKAAVLEEFSKHHKAEVMKRPELMAYLTNFKRGKIGKHEFNHGVQAICTEMLGHELRSKIALALIREKLANPGRPMSALLKNANKTRPDSNYDAEELKKGIKVEMEHTDSVEFATEITKDHLDEDPKYYTNHAD